jgi:FMN phosphatase YigB (HAD superfamily)
VEALLFDLGRVVIDIDTARVHARWAELAGVSAAEIERRALLGVAGSEAFLRYERGEITDAAFFAHVRTALAVELSDADLAEGWNAIFVGEMAGIRPLLAHAGQVLPLYAFSNTNAVHQACWSVRFAEVLAAFRKIHVSNEMGACKPEAAAFLAVAADMGVLPHRILFFDDLAENVAGAQACGMQAVQVSTTADIERALRDLGIR